jgi:large repetitive protein
MIVWGGGCNQPGLLTCHSESYEGGRYDPQTDSWTPTTLDGVPEARIYHTAVWTGDAMIVWGGIGTWNGYRHTGGLYYATTPENAPPVASDDNYETMEGATLNIPAPGVLENDHDPDGNPLSALLVSTTMAGALVLNGDGSFTYVPEAGFVGADQFTYRSYDGQATSNLATVTITINEIPNSAPTAVDDSYEGQQDELLLIAAPGVLANDSDPDGDPLTAVLVTPTSSGALTLNPDGSFSYMPAAGFVGADQFTYRADDGQATSNLATVTITINEIPNSAPTAVDDSYEGQQDELLLIAAPGVLANDSDPDGDPLTAVLVTPTSSGALTLNLDGSFSYMPEAGFAGIDTFTYRVNDGQGSSDTATVTITVQAPEKFQLFLPMIQR